MNEVGGDRDFERWYRMEHARLLSALTVAAGDIDLADDVVAEAFSRALERWDRVARMDSPTGWTYRVAVNVLRRRQRRATFERRILARGPRPSEQAPPTIDPDLWAVVCALPSRQRAVLGLRVVLDLSQKQTAHLLGIREGTVSATLVDARRNVARMLTEPQPIPVDQLEVDRG